MKNPNPVIATADNYREIIGIPDANDNVNTRQRLNHWLNQATDQFDSMISSKDEFNKLYTWWSKLSDDNPVDVAKKYKIIKAICSWVETFILNGKIWADGVPDVNSNINIDIASSSENSNVELKRKDIIQDLVTLGLYRTTNLAQTQSTNFNKAQLDDIKNWIITTTDELTNEFVRLNPRRPMLGALPFNGNPIVKTGSVSALITGGGKYKLENFKLINCTIDFKKNVIENMEILESVNAINIWDPKDQTFKTIDMFPADYWGGPQWDEILNAIYASGTEYRPDFFYKQGWITQKVNNHFLIKWYRAKRDNIGKDPETSPDDWELLQTQIIDINLIIDQLKPYINQVVADEFMAQFDNALNQRKHNFVQESPNQVFMFENEADFTQYKQDNNLTDADWIDVNDPVPPLQLPNNVAMKDQANIFSEPNHFQHNVTFGGNSINFRNARLIEAWGPNNQPYVPNGLAEIATKKYVDDKAGQNNGSNIRMFHISNNITNSNQTIIRNLGIDLGKVYILNVFYNDPVSNYFTYATSWMPLRGGGRNDLGITFGTTKLNGNIRFLIYYYS